LAVEVRLQRQQHLRLEASAEWEPDRVEVFLVDKEAQVCSVVVNRSLQILGSVEEVVSLGEMQRHKEDSAHLEPLQVKVFLTTREPSSKTANSHNRWAWPKDSSTSTAYTLLATPTR